MLAVSSVLARRLEYHNGDTAIGASSTGFRITSALHGPESLRSHVNFHHASVFNKALTNQNAPKHTHEVVCFKAIFRMKSMT